MPVTRLTLFFLLMQISHIQAADIQESVIMSIHDASQNIIESSDVELITDSLYKQMRPKAKVTNKTLGSGEIDKKVRKYISETYAPILIKNYKSIYSQLIKANKILKTCNANKIAPINTSGNVLKSLCVSKEKDIINVSYMTNAYSQGWSKSSDFVFSENQGEYKLIAIILQLKDGARVYVEGI